MGACVTREPDCCLALSSLGTQLPLLAGHPKQRGPSSAPEALREPTRLLSFQIPWPPPRGALAKTLP